MSDRRALQTELLKAILIEIELREATTADALIALTAALAACIEAALEQHGKPNYAAKCALDLLIARLNAIRHKH
jgi:hypothetical protein